MEQLINVLIIVATVWGGIYFINLRKLKTIDKRSWFFGLSAIALIPFGVAWAVTSLFEGEAQAAVMGILIFSGLGAVFALLAWKGIFPRLETVKQEPSGETSGLGVKITAAVLLAVAVLSLPTALTMKKISAVLGDREAVSHMFSDSLLSDEALPQVIKKGLEYQTLYGDYPDSLEVRLMQSVVSGVEDEEMIKLLGIVIPEAERLQLGKKATTAVANWLTSEAAYPELELRPSQYTTRVTDNAEEIVRWIYRNFHLPPMEAARVQKFANLEFSDNFKDYIGTPPDSIKELLIAPAAQAFKSQIGSVKIPEVISLSEKIARKSSAAQLTSQKSKIRNIDTLLGVAWILPLLLIIAALVMIHFSKAKAFPWFSWTAFFTGLVGLGTAFWLSDSICITEGLIAAMVEAVPPPGLAVVYSLLPNLLYTLGQSLIPMMTVTTLLGVILLGIVYFSNIKKLF